MFSIRRYLLATLLAVATLSMAVTAWVSYHEADHEVRELFDAQLAQSARVLVATLTTRPLLPESDSTDTVVFPVWQSAVAGDEEPDPRRLAGAGHKYETRLVFQLWEGVGERLLMRSSNAPVVALAPFADGYAEIELDGERFVVFTLQHEGLWLQVAHDDYMRDELAGEIALATVLPNAIGIPVMALLIWLLLGRGLRPLSALRTAIAGRSGGNLAPVHVSPSSIELEPMVDELNDLLTRLGESFERERRFTADAAHELRTPLAVLRIHAENALAAAGDEERRGALEMLLRGVDRAARLVEQLLTIARLEPEAAPETFTSLRLDTLVREELAALAPVAARRGQEFDLSATGAFTVRGDRALVGILVRNLVDNALRYSPPDSLVRVALRADPRGHVEMTVEDEGPGVPAELSERVFERFYRAASGRGDGAGLGLAIVRRIVDLHGGVVEARPRTDEHRSGFIVRLPAALPD